MFPTILHPNKIPRTLDVFEVTLYKAHPIFQDSTQMAKSMPATDACENVPRRLPQDFAPCRVIFSRGQETRSDQSGHNKFGACKQHLKESLFAKRTPTRKIEWEETQRAVGNTMQNSPRNRCAKDG